MGIWDKGGIREEGKGKGGYEGKLGTCIEI